MRTLDPNLPNLDARTLQQALQEDRTLLAAFYANWCGFSHAFLPTLEHRANDLPVPVVTIDISSSQDPLWSKHKIRTVPTLILFRDGEETHRVNGRPGQGLKGDDIDTLIEHVPP